jgi:hypothetical protein
MAHNMTYIEEVAQRIRQHVPPEAVPDGDVDELFLIYASLALAKGSQVDRRDVHNAWAAWMASREPDHDSIRPYEELSLSTKEEDDPFVTAIRAAVKETR